MDDPQSEILSNLYRQNRAEANRLADAAGKLTVWEAAALGRDPEVDRLLAGDAALANAFSPDGYFPLGLAAFFGHPATVSLLLKCGADIHAVARNQMKVQALHAAVASRRLETVALLLERGAEVNARQQVGYTPLMGAAAGGRDDIVQLLLDHGADPSLVSEDGKTAASVAHEHGHAQLAERLTPRRV
jgi:ankyrin repeat protein